MPTATGKYTVTINIEQPGTNHTEGTNTAPSKFGHVWVSGTDANGVVKQAGFAPVNEKTGILPVPGEVKRSDASAYAGDPHYSKTFEVTKAQ